MNDWEMMVCMGRERSRFVSSGGNEWEGTGIS